MKRSARFLLLFFSCLLLLCLTSCVRSSNENSVSDSESVSEQSDTSKVQDKNDAIMEKFDVNGDGKLKVLFIGNSYTLSFDIPAKFKNIAKTQGINLGVYVKAESGYHLSMHYNELKDYSDYIQNSDVVVMQDYGGIWADTEEMIPKIQALFDEKVKFYYYPYSASSAIFKSLNVQNITFVPTGDILIELTKKYPRGTFIENDHNNDLCSYVFANAIYSVIFDADCTDFTYKSIITTNSVPGETIEEKEAFLLECRQAVMKVLNTERNGDSDVSLDVRFDVSSKE